jgi:hypothetical protein
MCWYLKRNIRHFALVGVLQKGVRRCCVLCVGKAGRQETNSKSYRKPVLFPAGFQSYTFQGEVLASSIFPPLLVFQKKSRRC